MMRLLEKLLAGPPTRYRGVMGVYYYVDDAAETVGMLRQQGHLGDVPGVRGQYQGDHTDGAAETTTR